jgi:hypothetical protein
MPDKVGMDEPQEPLPRTITARTLAAALLYELRSDPDASARALENDIKAYLRGGNTGFQITIGFES